jgi:hypothetical protein
MTNEAKRIRQYRAKRQREGYKYLQVLAHVDDHQVLRLYAISLEAARQAKARKT